MADGLNRCSQSLFGRPALIEPGNDRSAIQPGKGSPLGDAQRFTVESDMSIRPAVSGLFDRRRPAAVARLVVAVVVDAIKLVLRRRFRPHVCKKVSEAGKPEPPIANLDAASPVAVVAIVAPIETAATHGRPRLVLAGAGSPPGTAVRHFVSIKEVSHARTPSVRVGSEQPRALQRPWLFAL